MRYATYPIHRAPRHFSKEVGPLTIRNLWTTDLEGGVLAQAVFHQLPTSAGTNLDSHVSRRILWRSSVQGTSTLESRSAEGGLEVESSTENAIEIYTSILLSD